MFDTRLIQKIFLLLALVSIQKVSAQDIESLIKTYPNDLAVMTIYKRELKLSVQKNQPYGQSKEDVEMVMLNDRVNGMYNKYNVYHGSFDELKQMEAYTKVPDGNKYKKIKVAETKTQNAESRSVFYDDVQETTFDFPALMKGSIASVSHTVLHKDIHMLSPFYFMSYMPIVSASYTVTFPSDMDVRYIIRNNNNNTISVKEDLSGNQHSFVFTANNIPLTERFSNAPGVSYYEPHVIVYVASYTNDDNQQVTVFNTLKDFYKWNYSFLKGINEDQSELIKHLADSLTEKLATPIAKAKAIYQWVQEHIKYVAFENGLEGFVPRQAKDVCTKRYGDCKDMSSLITALLRAVDLKGYYTWIGTRDIAYDYDDVHLPMTDNHMISTLNIGDEWLFLDGTDPNCVFGMPSEAIQGKQALLAIDGDNYKVIRVPEVDADKNKIIDSTFINLTDKGIQGNMSVYYSGYFGSNIYNTLQYKDPKDIKEYVKYKMSKASNKFILGDYSINDIDKGQKFINIKAGFEVPDYGKKIGDEFYINLNLEKIFSNANIDTAKRKIASDNSYKYVIDEYSILSIPDNYKVNYLPSNVSIDKGAYSFLIQYTQEAKRVIAKLEVRSNNLWMQPSEFSTWNTALKELINHYKEQVVLQKK
jgi:transglutaminase-like putative cysteine protease